MDAEIEAATDRVKEATATLHRFRDEVAKVVVGQRLVVDRLLLGLLTGGHVLLEGLPGLAKTLVVRCMADAFDASFRRIQFTPDLLPADVVGTLVYEPGEGRFRTRLGPIFANVILADEINRAPAKVQSALLEAMQERQVTIGEESHTLPDPFLVLATQNPVEQEGTYPLPEAQTDRFFLKVRVDYPTRDEERRVIDRMARTNAVEKVQPVLTPADVAKLRTLVDDVYVDDKVKEYVLDIVGATRDPKKHGLDLQQLIRYGASPRASLALILGAKAQALLEGRAYVTPQDIKEIGPDVLRHRVVVSYEAEAEELDSDALVQRIFDGVPVP